MGSSNNYSGPALKGSKNSQVGMASTKKGDNKPSKSGGSSKGMSYGKKGY